MAKTSAQVRKCNPPIGRPRQPSIAVLPFAQVGSGAKSEIQPFTDGISDEIAARLSKYKELCVIAGLATLGFKDRNVTLPEVASALGAHYVIEGSVCAGSKRVRVAAQLVDGVWGNQVWAYTCERDLSDLLVFQDDVPRVIVATVAGRLIDAERAKTRMTEPMALGAFGWLLKGQDALLRYSRDGNLEAQECLQRAIQISPDCARAYAALSRAYHYEWQFQWSEGWQAALQKALDAANKAIDLDAEDPHGYAERGYVYLFMKQPALAMSELRRAHDMNPNDADLMAVLAYALIYDGQLDEAVGLIRRAMRLNPHYPDSYLWYLADAYYALHRYEDTISAVLQMHNPNAGRGLLAASYGQLGQLEMARKQAEEVLRLQPDFAISAYAATQPESNSLELEHFLEGLRKAGLPD